MRTRAAKCVHGHQEWAESTEYRDGRKITRRYCRVCKRKQVSEAKKKLRKIAHPS